MATMIELYSGGTTGVLDGTRISSGTWAQPVGPPSALDTVLTLHYRAIDGTTADDTGEDTTTTFTYTAPTGWLVSADNTTFGATATLPIAVGANKPIYFKQTARQSSANSTGQMATGGVTFAAGTRVAAPVVTLTAGVHSITPTFVAVADADGYQYRLSTDGGTTYGAWAACTSGSAITGLALGTAYTVQVRAWSELGAGAADTETATTTVHYWTDTFADSSIDTDIWLAYESANGTVTEGAGTVTIDGTSAIASLAMLKALGPIVRTVSGKLTVNQQQMTGSDHYSRIILTQSNHSTASSSTQYVVFLQLYPTGYATLGKQIQLRYYNADGVARYYDGSAWQSTAAYLPSGSGQHLYEDGDVCRLEVTMNASAETITLAVTHVGNSYTSSSTVAYADIRDNSLDELYFQALDNATLLKMKTILQDATYGAI